MAVERYCLHLRLFGLRRTTTSLGPMSRDKYQVGGERRNHSMATDELSSGIVLRNFRPARVQPRPLSSVAIEGYPQFQDAPTHGSRGGLSSVVATPEWSSSWSVSETTSLDAPHRGWLGQLVGHINVEVECPPDHSKSPAANDPVQVIGGWPRWPGCGQGRYISCAS